MTDIVKTNQTPPERRQKHIRTADAEKWLEQKLELRLQRFEKQILQSIETIVRHHVGAEPVQPEAAVMAAQLPDNASFFTAPDPVAFGSPMSGSPLSGSPISGNPGYASIAAGFNTHPPVPPPDQNVVSSATMAARADDATQFDTENLQAASQIVSAALDHAIRTHLVDAMRDGGILNRLHRL